VTFKEVMDQVITWLQQDQRISYRALKRQFALEDDYLDDLKVKLIEVKQMAVDQDGKMLVWRGNPASAAASAPTGPPQHAPLAYTPSYLAEKILTSRGALEGERKQVTVLFADLKDSTALIRGLALALSGWWKGSCGCTLWGPCRSRACQTRWTSLSWLGPVRYGGAYRLPPCGG
jgi:hypothetical protein